MKAKPLMIESPIYFASVPALCALYRALNFLDQPNSYLSTKRKPANKCRRMLSRSLNITALTLINISVSLCPLQILPVLKLTLSSLFHLFQSYFCAFVHSDTCLSHPHEKAAFIAKDMLFFMPSGKLTKCKKKIKNTVFKKNTEDATLYNSSCREDYFIYKYFQMLIKNCNFLLVVWLFKASFG